MFISCMHLFCESSVISANSRFLAVHYLAAAFPTPSFSCLCLWPRFAYSYNAEAVRGHSSFGTEANGMKLLVSLSFFFLDQDETFCVDVWIIIASWTIWPWSFETFIDCWILFVELGFSLFQPSKAGSFRFLNVVILLLQVFYACHLLKVEFHLGSVWLVGFVVTWSAIQVSSARLWPAIPRWMLMCLIDGPCLDKIIVTCEQLRLKLLWVFNQSYSTTLNCDFYPSWFNQTVYWSYFCWPVICTVIFFFLDFFLFMRRS